MRLWLIKRNLSEFIDVFGIESGDNQRIGIEGEELLEMDMNRLFEDPYNAAEMLDIKEEDRQSHPLIERFFRYNLLIYSVSVYLRQPICYLVDLW